MRLQLLEPLHLGLASGRLCGRELHGGQHDQYCGQGSVGCGLKQCFTLHLRTRPRAALTGRPGHDRLLVVGVPIFSLASPQRTESNQSVAACWDAWRAGIESLPAAISNIGRQELPLNPQLDPVDDMGFDLADRDDK